MAELEKDKGSFSQEAKIPTERVSEVLAELHRRMDWKSRRKNSYSSFGEHLEHVGHVMCADGLRMSVQASAYHYCQPRESVGPWYSVEVGFPNRRVEKLMRWMEDWGDTQPTEAVYGYVPIEVVAEVIADAGGFASEDQIAALDATQAGTDERSEGVDK